MTTEAVDHWWAFGWPGKPAPFDRMRRSLLDAIYDDMGAVVHRWCVTADGESGHSEWRLADVALGDFARWCAERAVRFSGPVRGRLAALLDAPDPDEARAVVAACRRGSAEWHAAMAVGLDGQPQRWTLARIASHHAIQAAAEAAVARLPQERAASPTERFGEWEDAIASERSAHEWRLRDRIGGFFESSGVDR